MSFLAGVAVGVCVFLLTLPDLARHRLCRLPGGASGAPPTDAQPTETPPTTRLSRRARRRQIDDTAPIAFALLAASLRAGSAVPSALATLGAALTGPLGTELRAAAERARLGADPAAAWNHEPDSALAALGRTLSRASRSGAPVADLLEQAAVDRRRIAHTNARARAHRAGVLVVLPLGLCFLPAFVLIGVAPLAAGLLLDLV